MMGATCCEMNQRMTRSVQRKINHEELNFLDVEALAGAEKNPPEGSTSGRLERLIKTYFTVYSVRNFNALMVSSALYGSSIKPEMTFS